MWINSVCRMKKIIIVRVEENTRIKDYFLISSKLHQQPEKHWRK